MGYFLETGYVLHLDRVIKQLFPLYFMCLTKSKEAILILTF